jgi:hypothetical protein
MYAKIRLGKKKCTKIKGGYLPFDIFGDKFRKSFFPHTSNCGIH